MAKVSANYEVVYIIDPAQGEEGIAALVNNFSICTAAINDNKIHVLLSKCRICESFGTKKTLQDCSCKVIFSIMVLLLGIAQ